MSEEKYLGRVVKRKESFKREGTFHSLVAAHNWLHEHNYGYGSTCKDRYTGHNCPVAIQLDGYDLPEKWINMDDEDKQLADGVIVSNDFREGEVTIYIFN